MLQLQTFKSIEQAIETAVDSSHLSAILDWLTDTLHQQISGTYTELPADYETSLNTFEENLGILGVYLLTESGDEEQIPEITKGGSLEISEEITSDLAMHYYAVNDGGGFVFFCTTK
jgi:predicted hydrolase (HD superfamily)